MDPLIYMTTSPSQIETLKGVFSKAEEEGLLNEYERNVIADVIREMDAAVEMQV